MIQLAPKSKNTMTYSAAILYCQFLDYGGHRDWRIPTYNEFVLAPSLTDCWFTCDQFLDESTGNEWRVIPVRDVC